MASVSEPPDRPQLDADDLAWTLEPVPLVEDVDLLTFSSDETRGYARELQSECRTLRLLLHDALALAARLTQQIEHYRQRLAHLVKAAKRAQRVTEARR